MHAQSKFRSKPILTRTARQERRGHLVPLLRILQNLKSRQAFETQSFRWQSAASARTSGRSLKELLRSARSSFRRCCIGRQLQSWRKSYDVAHNTASSEAARSEEHT